MSVYLAALVLLLVLLPHVSCTPDFLEADRKPDTLFGPSEGDRTVVEALLVVDGPLPPVVLRRTLDPGVPYEASRTGLVGAEVAIRSGDEVFAYSPDPEVPGLYLPPAGAPAVFPDRVYELLAETGDGEVVRAATHTPQRLDIGALVLLDDDFETEVRHLRLFAEIGDEVYQAVENQLEYTQGGVEVRLGQIGDAVSYQFAVTNLERNSPLLFDAGLFDEDEDDFGREETSRLLGLDEGGIFLSWDGIFFAGRYKVKLFAVDQNWFDLVRTDNIDAERGSGEAGQGFQRPLFHIDNGVGLFASAAVDSVGFFVRPKDSPACSGCECWGCNDRGAWAGSLDLNTRRGQIGFELEVSSGANCQVSYEISRAVSVAPCTSCSFSWQLTLGKLNSLNDEGGCGAAKELSGLTLGFAQGTAREGGTLHYGLYREEDGVWQRIEGGWSMVASQGEAAGQWLFGFTDD
jgi:hypothetical protein